MRVCIGHNETQMLRPVDQCRPCTRAYIIDLCQPVSGTRCSRQGRRLVINIGGQKFGSQILGGKNFLKIYFKKKIFKSSLQFSKKILTTFFLVIEIFFKKNVHFSLKM